MTTKLLAPIQEVYGTAYSGYQLFTYLAGTTTKTSTWKSDTGAVAHTNPIILDANGLPPSGTGIWVTPFTLYKFVLTTAADTDPPALSTLTLDNA